MGEGDGYFTLTQSGLAGGGGIKFRYPGPCDADYSTPPLETVFSTDRGYVHVVPGWG